jgi:predicted transcriptional regulator
MTAPAVVVAPETTVEEIARLLLKRGISAVPVIAADGRLAGIVSEGDLMRRVESGTERTRSWWLSVFGDVDAQAREYAKSHGRRAADVDFAIPKKAGQSGLQSGRQLRDISQEHRARTSPGDDTGR